jgi:restriction endonuclease S subunit
MAVKVKVNEITDIQIGYQSRGRIEPDPTGTHRIIQMKDFDECHQLGIDSLTSFYPERDPERYLVDQGDVLFLSRGQKNFACAVTIALQDTVAASYFFILRIKRDAILPEYLAWYINQVPAQEFIYTIAKRGSHMPIVPKSSFETLEISVPPLETQKTIVKIEKLISNEEEIGQEISLKRGLLMRAFCFKKIKEQS